LDWVSFRFGSLELCFFVSGDTDRPSEFRERNWDGVVYCDLALIGNSGSGLQKIQVRPLGVQMKTKQVLYGYSESLLAKIVFVAKRVGDFVKEQVAHPDGGGPVDMFLLYGEGLVGRVFTSEPLYCDRGVDYDFDL
jgi:hypothetical protein